jgi:hypothetical protein
MKEKKIRKTNPEKINCPLSFAGSKCTKGHCKFFHKGTMKSWCPYNRNIVFEN